jgi:arylsulfatase A-like enzyme
MDASIARFAQRLQAAGIWDRAAVLFVGDHGEAFREHEYASHGGPGFDETSRVLAVLKLPKGDARNGTVFREPVSSIDFLPLLVNVAGMPEWGGFQGRSPFEGNRNRPVFTIVRAFAREEDVLRWPWKLLNRTYPDRAIELYNLEADAGELRNVAREQPEITARLVADLESFHTCQVSYYGDRSAYERLHPPRYD